MAGETPVSCQSKIFCNFPMAKDFKCMKNIFLPLLLTICSILFFSCRQPTGSPLSIEADNLIDQVVQLNQLMIVTDLDSIHQIQVQILSDLDLLTENLGLLAEAGYDPEIYRRFDSLSIIIGYCLASCNDFYQEISVIERHLEIILDDITGKEVPDSVLANRLEQETVLLSDLTDRIINRLDIMKSQLQIYNEIQPSLDEYMTIITGE